jgi:hypothetical protein
MISVKFSEQRLYEYIKFLTEKGWQDVFKTQFNDPALVIQVEKAELARLLTRLNNHQPTAIPYIENKKCYWIVTAADAQALDKTIRRLGYFLIPSYAELLEKDGIANRQKFDPEKGGFNLLGTRLFPHGFYQFRSADTRREEIFEILGLWMGLEEAKPTPVQKERPSYFDHYKTFQEKLEAGNWADAQRALDSIRRLSLSTAENISFLKIQLWGAQKEWGKIWDLPDYPDLSKLTIPRKVRAEMLSAFYWQVMQPLEGKYDLGVIFQTLDDHRAKLGRLLTGRFGIGQAEVIRVFAYLAVKDQNRDSFEGLLQDSHNAGLDEFIKDLERRLPVKLPVLVNQDPLKVARLAIGANDFDGAARAVMEVSNILDKTFLYIQIAVLSGDQSAESIKKALDTLEALGESQKEELNKQYPQTPKYLRFLENAANAPEFPSAWDEKTAELRSRGWSTILEFEIRHRKLVETQYRKHFGPQWWKQIDQDLFEHFQRAAGSKVDLQTAATLLEYSTISDLEKLTSRRWEYFEDVYGNEPVDKTYFKRAMKKVITVRNELAHIRPVSVDDLNNQILFCNILIKKLDKASGNSQRIA